MTSMKNPINYWYQKYISLKDEMDKMMKESKRLVDEEQADLFTIVALDAAQRAKNKTIEDTKEIVKQYLKKANNAGNNLRNTTNKMRSIFGMAL